MARTFRDRREAGTLLASMVMKLNLHDPLVLAIPRGGVVTGYEVAKALRAALDLVVVRKVGAPGEPELAIGAVMHDGKLFLNEEMVAFLGVTRPYIEEEKKRQMAEAVRRLRVYRGDRPYPSLEGRDVLIVDDGVATGATVTAAVRWSKSAGARKVVVAAPVAPRDAVRALSKEADEVVLCDTPDQFYAIGQFYQEFDQVSDEEVILLLSSATS